MGARAKKDPTWYALLGGVWGADNLAPSFQPSASRACAYVACTFVYRKGGLRLAVVGLCRGSLTRSTCELPPVGSAPFPHLVIEL